MGWVSTTIKAIPINSKTKKCDHVLSHDTSPPPAFRPVLASGSRMQKTTHLELGVGPARNFDDKVEDGLLRVGVEGNIMEGGVNDTVLFYVVWKVFEQRWSLSNAHDLFHQVDSSPYTPTVEVRANQCSRTASKGWHTDVDTVLQGVGSADDASLILWHSCGKCAKGTSREGERFYKGSEDKRTEGAAAKGKQGQDGEKWNKRRRGSAGFNWAADWLARSHARKSRHQVWPASSLRLKTPSSLSIFCWTSDSPSQCLSKSRYEIPAPSPLCCFLVSSTSLSFLS